LSFYFLLITTYFDKTEIYVSSYGKPDFAIAKGCFINLLETAIKANFLLFPLHELSASKEQEFSMMQRSAVFGYIVTLFLSFVLSYNMS